MGDYNITVAPTDFGPCGVCGAPGGNCRGDSHYRGSIVIEPIRRKDPRATFRVPQRVYEEVVVGKRKTKRLLYRKGEAITPAEAKRLGLIPDSDKPERPKA